MTTGQGSPYSDFFFDKQKSGSLSSARIILGELFTLLGEMPRQVVDVGCGVGTWLRAAQELGSTTVRGFDGPWVTEEQLEIPREYFHACDLVEAATAGTLPGTDGLATYDLVLSLEVAEHLPTAVAKDFVALISKLGERILFSAAIPYQGGVNHLNEDWPGSWNALFCEQGFECFDPIRARVWDNAAVEWWYAQNVLLFAKGAAADGLRRQIAPVAVPAALVHPRKYLLQIVLEEELRAALVAATAAPFPALTPFTAELGHLERKVAGLRARLDGHDPATYSGAAADILELTSLYDRVRHQSELLANEVKRLEGQLLAVRTEYGREVAAYGREVAALKASLAKKTCELGSAQRYTESLLASKSWRVTSPLRFISRIGRRILGRV